MLSVPMNKVNGKQQQMVTGSRLKILRKSQKEILEIKTTIIEMKNAFDGLIRLKMSKKESVILDKCQ